MTLWSSGEETPLYAAERVLGVDIAYLQVLEQLDIESLHDLCSWTLLEDIHIYVYMYAYKSASPECRDHVP